MRVRLAAAVLLAATLLAGAGCSQVEDVLTPGPKVVTREATTAASAAEVTGELAPGQPQSLPLWPGAEVLNSRGDEQTYSLTLVTSEVYGDVLAGMVAGFEGEGWEVVQEDVSEEGSQSAVLTVTGAEASGIVTVTTLSDGTVSIAYVLASGE